jgi:site-specific DNA-methyltransferase (adenine-specific)
MKFDVVVGNPPYQDKKGNEGSTNSADLYTKFISKSLTLSKKYVAMVVPSAWTGPKNSSLKETIFEENQPTVLNTHGKKWFNVEMNTCYFITEVGRKGQTVVSDAAGNSMIMNLDKSTSLSTNLSMMALKNKISSFAKVNNFGSKWIRGSLHLNQVNSSIGNSVEFIKAVGRKGVGLDTVMIKNGVESTGYGISKLVIPNMGGSSGIGHVKIAKKNQVGGHSVVFLTANKESELKNMKAYLESKTIRFLIDAVKISTPNSKTLFTFIPVIDFTRSWTDSDLYKYFNLTQAEIDYIEENVK